MNKNEGRAIECQQMTDKDNLQDAVDSDYSDYVDSNESFLLPIMTLLVGITVVLSLLIFLGMYIYL